MTKLAAVLAFLTALTNTSLDPTSVDRKLVVETAAGIVALDADWWEMETLAKLAWYDGGMRRNLADCTVVDADGRRGIFQIVPRDGSERLRACSSNAEAQARLALSRIRESRKICEARGMRGSDALSYHTAGRCVRGESRALLRYGDGTALERLASAR